MTQKAFKYRFYPTPEQETLLRRSSGLYSFGLQSRPCCENTGLVRTEEASRLQRYFGNVDRMEKAGRSAIPQRG